jgi:hypothetical protein
LLLLINILRGESVASLHIRRKPPRPNFALSMAANNSQDFALMDDVANEKFLQATSLLATNSPAHLGRDRREDALPLEKLSPLLDQTLSKLRLSSDRETLIRSLVLLWHDHLDESHEISQSIHTTDGSYLHGIMHRREPDFSNARYWFNRVSSHPIFAKQAEQLDSLLSGSSVASWKNTLVKNGLWQPFGFIDLIEQHQRSERETVQLLERIQELEFRLLLHHFCR